MWRKFEPPLLTLKYRESQHLTYFIYKNYRLFKSNFSKSRKIRRTTDHFHTLLIETWCHYDKLSYMFGCPKYFEWKFLTITIRVVKNPVWNYIISCTFSSFIVNAINKLCTIKRTKIKPANQNYYYVQKLSQTSQAPWLCQKSLLSANSTVTSAALHHVFHPLGFFQKVPKLTKYLNLSHIYTTLGGQSRLSPEKGKT